MRKSIFIIVTLLQFIHPWKSNAQNAEVAGVATAAVIAGLSMASQIQQYREMLETQALNHLIDNHPTTNAFTLKILDTEGKKLSDQGDLSVMTFKITEFEKATGKEFSRSVLLMFTSPGWISEFGVDLDLVTWKRIARNEWNHMFSAFLELNSMVQIQDQGFTFNVSEKVKNKELDKNAIDQYSIHGKTWRLTDETATVTQGTLERAGFGLIKGYDVDLFPITDIVIPFIPLKNDDYLITNYSEEFTLVANEKAMGLFLKNTNETIQLQRTLVSKIHGYLNKLPFAD